MQEQISIINQIIQIKIGALIAGLLGALITMLRKSQGTIQARLVGYLTAIVTIIYVLPFISWFIEWKFQFVMHDTAEHLIAFILGMTAQRLTESFIDDPSGTFYLWTAQVKRFKRVVWNNESFTSVTDTKQNTDNPLIGKDAEEK